MNKQNTTTVTGTRVPAYFLGRPRNRYVAAMASRQDVRDEQFARAA